MSKRKGYALTTRSYYVDDRTGLSMYRSGSLYGIGCVTAAGEIVQIEMSERHAHKLHDFLASSPAGKRCDRCEPEEN